jgi:hypothetical protein
MIHHEMSLQEVYRHRESIEQADKMLYYFNKAGQRQILHLAASQELQHGKNYPVLIERQDGQLLRTYLLASHKVYVGEEP